ncbi:MAG: Cysteine desulfurase [Bacteroidetes bacterium ADurb.Bin408]|nr:MAG: Cysteine desulfurase [Bacteroidetes bacterium ADurb.Bin408]
MTSKAPDILAFREDFPILKRSVYNKPLVYFDNAATTQKPQVVIDRIVKYYAEENANIHRGVHYLSQHSTMAFENVREQVRLFLNANHAHEIIFTRGTTESINLIASSFASKHLLAGDEILITQMEHHSNIVPWQLACEAKKATLKYIPFNEPGELELSLLDKLLTPRVKLLALTHLSNALGTINPVKEIIAKAHQKGIPVLIDGAQAVAHIKVDVQELDCDFYCFSGHKIYGPMGIGVLYGKEKWLNDLPPYQGGGEMIKTVSLEKGTTYNDLPFKFEAGTPNVSDVLGLETALNYIQNIGLEHIAAWENKLLTYASTKLQGINGLQVIGRAKHKSSVLSFIVEGIHPYDIGTLLDKMGIAVRTGHHCAQPVMDRYGISGTVRASFSFYNTKEEIDVFCEALKKAIEMLK